MSLQISLPFGSKNNVKSLVFSILAKEYPLKIIEIKNLISKRYGKNVSFQAVRKAMLELVEEGILLRKDYSFIVNKQWVFDSKKLIDELYSTIYQEKTKVAKMDSIGEEISVFTFNSVAEMMKFWENLINDWVENIEKDKLKVNCYQTFHAWESLLYPETEQKLMAQLKRKGVKSYILSGGRTKLDKVSLDFYKKMGVTIIKSNINSLFDKEYAVGTYGSLVVQAKYPPEIVLLLEDFFRKAKAFQSLDLKELSDILNKKIDIKLSVTKNINMAKQINQSIISQI
jgi:hypothetical protein